MKNKNNGLRQEIAKAATKESVNDLLVIGTQYTNASKHTKRRWLNTARKRLKQILDVGVPEGAQPTATNSINTAAN